MACGAGMFVIPIFCTIIGLASLAALKGLEHKITRDSYKVVHVECNVLGEQTL